MKLKFILHWPRFGPYHLARLRASRAFFSSLGLELIGLETASSDHTYKWRMEKPYNRLDLKTLFPEKDYENVRWVELWKRLNTFLTRINPSAVAINGYASKDALLLLLWCQRNRRPAILMSDTKADDAERYFLKEQYKRVLLRRFSGALVAGTLHKDYLQKLGLSEDQIFLGYDVVDNDYFRRSVSKMKEHPSSISHLPGLNDSEPFFLASNRFISRKNLMGLLDAYTIYRRQAISNGTEVWRLILLGDGPEREHLVHFIASQGLGDQVILPGFRQIDELPAYYGSAKVFIHPALQDQWGLVVNEAMASGLPVIVSTHCGCVPDLIQEGVNGFTFDPQDPGALADLMTLMSSGEVDLNVMGAFSLNRISKWGPEKFAQGLFNVLEISLTSRRSKTNIISCV